jgi:ribonuclease-3 family protein
MLIDQSEAVSQEKAARMPPLVLAYIGDSVYDMYVRTRLVLSHAGGAGALHVMSAGIVNARAQAALARLAEDRLTDWEKDVFRRGRNAKSATTPKNMSVADYRYATAIEAVVGYLYLTGQGERLAELLAGTADAARE